MGVVMTTILWSLGVATLVPSVVSAADASCPTLVAGDLIKVSGKPAIYALDNNLNYRYFPDGDVFKSWNSDESYSKYYKSITQACFDSLAQPAAAPYHVFYRAGSYLVKYLSSDTLYVVGLGNKLHPITDAAAKAIFGTNYTWKTIGLSEWPLYTKDTVTITEATVYPGALVKVDGKTYFVDEGKVLREVTAEGMTANRFKEAFVRTLPTSAIAGLTMGAEITSEVTTLTKRVGDSTTPGTPVASGKLTVALAMDTPAAASIPQNGSRVPFTKVNLTAGTDNAINVDAITVKRTGLSVNTNFDKVWVEKDGVRISSQQSINTSDEALLTFSPVLKISAGQTITLEVVASLNGTGSGNASLGISAASAVSAGGVTVAGSFPIFGNLMSLVTYNVATFDFDNVTTTRVVKAGDIDADLGSFGITATSTKDVKFKSIALRNSGGTEDLATTVGNLRLEKGGVVISQSATIDGRYVTFVVKDGGLLIEKGDYVNIKVKGDILAKEKTTDPALKWILNKAEDISVIEVNTGFGAKLNQSAPVTLNEVNFTAGSITITKKSTSPSDKDVIKGAKSQVVLIANIKADEAISAEGLIIKATSSRFADFENAKVTLNGYSLGTVTPSTTNTFDSSFTLNKGDNELQILVDVTTNASSTNWIKFYIEETTFVSVNGAPEYVASGNSVTGIYGSPEGAMITVKSADLTVTRNDGYSDARTIVKGAVNNVLAKFNVKAVNDSVKITSVEVINNAGVSTINPTAVSNMKIYVDGSAVADGKTYSTSSVTYSGLNISINEDSVKPFEVHADFDSNNTGAIQFTVKIYFEDIRNKEANKSEMSAITTVIDTGSLVVDTDAGTPKADILLAKAGEYPVAMFKLSAVKDSANITELTWQNNTGSLVTTTDSRISAYKLYKGTTLEGTTLLDTQNPTLGVTTFKISGNALTIPANTSEIVTVKAVFNEITDRAQTGAYLQAKLTGYKFKSSAGTEYTTTTLAYSGEKMTIRKTMPTFAQGTALVGEVLRFTVTADTNEDVVINKLNFRVSGSGAASSTNFKLYDDGTQASSTIAAPTAGQVTWDNLTITVAKGTTKTLYVKATTDGIAKDAKMTVSLDKETTGDIGWSEVFIDGGNVTGIDGAYLHGLPVSLEKTY